MQTFPASRFDKRMITKTLEMFFELARQRGDIRKAEILRWVKIVCNIIRLIKMRRSAMHLMQLDAGQVGQPDERRLFGRDDVILFFFTEGHILEPIGRPIGSILLKERFAADAVRITHQREGPPFDMR